MHFIKSLSAATALYALGYALPTESPSLYKRVLPCDDISMYTLDYFLEKPIYKPPRDTCLFYTEYLSDTAQRFAHDGRSMTTIWDIWTCFLYNGEDDLGNPLRCIFKDDKQRTTYFERMSSAMARLCSGFATVMTNNPTNIPQNGIWGRIEQRDLKLDGNPGGQVDKILAVDTSGGGLVEVWRRPGTPPTPPKTKTKSPRSTSPENENKALSKRQPNDCYSPDQLQTWFGDVKW